MMAAEGSGKVEIWSRSLTIEAAVASIGTWPLFIAVGWPGITSANVADSTLEVEDTMRDRLWK